MKRPHDRPVVFGTVSEFIAQPIECGLNVRQMVALQVAYVNSAPTKCSGHTSTHALRSEQCLLHTLTLASQYFGFQGFAAEHWPVSAEHTYEKQRAQKKSS